MLKNVSLHWKKALHYATVRSQTILWPQHILVRPIRSFEVWADSNLLLDALANGEINQIEHYKCVMGPGGPGPTWEQCTAECICDQPFCNCVPPEEGTSSETWFQPNLRDTTITCYPDPEE